MELYGLKKKLYGLSDLEPLSHLKKNARDNLFFSDTPSLPQDVLVHIFSLLDVSSLISSSQVSRYYYFVL